MPRRLVALIGAVVLVDTLLYAALAPILPALEHEFSLTKAQAGEFYAIHRERPFYGELVQFMTSGPCMPVVLEKADAVSALRDAIGATDPAEAAAGTVRKLYAESKGRTAIHASDSDENAQREARFFFAETDLLWG